MLNFSSQINTVNTVKLNFSLHSILENIKQKSSLKMSEKYN